MNLVLDRVIGLIPSNVPPGDTWSQLLGVDDPGMMSLLGLASEHVSHLHEIGAGNCVNVVKELELLGAAMLRLAVTHTVHLDKAPGNAGEANNAAREGTSAAYRFLANYLSLASTVRLGASLRGERDHLSPVVEWALVGQAIGAFTLCVGYARVRELVAGALGKPPQRRRIVLTRRRLCLRMRAPMGRR